MAKKKAPTDGGTKAATPADHKAFAEKSAADVRNAVTEHLQKQGMPEMPAGAAPTGAGAAGGVWLSLILSVVQQALPAIMVALEKNGAKIPRG
jgi:hypothetical protein